MSELKLEAYYGFPQEVKFCKKCVMSNQRPASTAEFKHTINSKKVTLNFDEEGVCDACRNAEIKESIDWEEREEQLLNLLDKYRRKDGYYDCLVPGSGGKDSSFQSHILKYKYGMNPLTVTWPPILYTDYGYENWKNLQRTGYIAFVFVLLHVLVLENGVFFGRLTGQIVLILGLAVLLLRALSQIMKMRGKQKIPDRKSVV